MGVSPTVAMYRRELIWHLLSSNGVMSRYRRVADLHEYVCNNWPDGFADSPSLGTIYKVLRVYYVDKLDMKYFGRGCYSYEAWRLREEK